MNKEEFKKITEYLDKMVILHQTTGETINKDLLAVASTTKTELLFLSLFARMLKLGGRCASIVPDGVLFGSSKAHKAIRQLIVDGNRLEAVISMPGGVFQPYSGVKTSILVFTKTGKGGTDNVWFYDMKNDGHSLDVKRQPIDGSDIPDIINRFHHLDDEKKRTRKVKSNVNTMKVQTTEQSELKSFFFI